MRRQPAGLQRFILRRASAQQRLYYAEILVEYFGWQPTQPLRRHDGTDPRFGAGELANPGLRRFNPDTIGRWRYLSTRVVLSRACSRLAARGLVRRLQDTKSHWAGVEITDAGRAWLAADALAAERERGPAAVVTTRSVAKPRPTRTRPCPHCRVADCLTLGTGTDRTVYCLTLWCGALVEGPNLPPLPTDHPARCSWCGCRPATTTLSTPSGNADFCALCTQARRERQRRKQVGR